MERFGAPRFLVSNQGPQFMSHMVKHFVNHYHITHKKRFPIPSTDQWSSGGYQQRVRKDFDQNYCLT